MTMGGAPILKVEKLHKRYGANHVLRDVDQCHGKIAPHPKETDLETDTRHPRCRVVPGRPGLG